MYEIKEVDASGEIADIYNDLRKSLNIKVVNTIWRYLATIDGGLNWVWYSSKELYMSGKLEDINQKISDNIEFPELPLIPDNVLSSIGISEKDKLEIIQIIKKYNIGNAKNMIGLSCFLKTYDKNIFLKPNVIIGNKSSINSFSDRSEITNKKTWQLINSLSEMFVNTNHYIPFPPGLYIELARWPNFLSLVWAMLSGLKKNNHLPKYTAILNKRTVKIIEPLLENMIVKSIPENKKDVMVPIHNLVTIVMPKMIMVGHMLINSLSNKN